MIKIFLNWVALVLGIYGFIYFIIAKSEDLISQMFGIGVTILTIVYFARFQKEILIKATQKTKSLINFDFVPKYFSNTFYSYALTAVVIMSAVTLFYNLGERDFWEDEYQVISAATGYYHTGEFFKWDWIKHEIKCGDHTRKCEYHRAWPHSWLIAQSYKIFGISEWSSRIVSALFMLTATIGMYFFGIFFTENKTVALLATFAFATHPSLILIGRYTRMYALLIPLFLLLTYLIFKAVSNKIHYGYAAATVIIMGLGFLIHINSLIILPAAFLFIAYLAITTRKKEPVVLFILGIVGLTAIYNMPVFTPCLNQDTGCISFFGRNNTIYLKYIAGFPLPDKLGFAITILGLISTALFLYNRVLKHKLTYLYAISLFAFFFFVYIGDRYASFVYTSHIVPIFILLMINSYVLLVNIIRLKALKILLVAALLIHPLYILYENVPRVYEGKNFGKISEAYISINENIKPGEPIFGQYLRKYYLQSLDPQTPVVGMLNRQNYSHQMFLEDISKYDSGWITWETRKSYHIQPSIRAYIDANFEKLNGNGIDGTRTEVYYFTKENIK